MRKRVPIYCVDCGWNVYSLTSRRRGICSKCEFMLSMSPMKNDPSLYIGSTKRFTLCQRLDRVSRWEQKQHPHFVPGVVQN